MSDNMNEKYQQYYNDIINGTLTESILKGITYQANIKLANDIIGEQDKVIIDLQKTLEDKNLELEELNKSKSEFESVKHQIQHLDTYRNELVKANDTIRNLQEQVRVLTEENQTLKTIQEVPKKPKAKIIKQDLPGMVVKGNGNS
jgi:flagellar biosynthesis chaperone FliJ